MSAPVPVITLCSTDAVMRGAATSALLWDLPGAVALQHDLDPRSGDLRRLVHDPAGVRQDSLHHLEHACASCAVREDIVPALEELASRRPAAILLALPTAIEAVPVLHALGAARGVIAAGVGTIVNLDTLSTDLTSQDLLAERGLAVAMEDDRLVAEVLVSQLESADLVLTSGEQERDDPVADALIDHLAGPGKARPWHSVPTEELLRARPTLARGDLMAVEATGAEPRDEVWTLDLGSWRPVHPERLMEHAEDLGGDAVRSKGHFWVATRPGLACAWDGAGGHVSVGRIGPWDARPATHLVVTGVGGDPRRVMDAFESVLLTDVELARGLDTWAGLADGLDPWLGAERDAA